MNNLEVFRDITTFIFDVDGILTNNLVLVTEIGELLRSMNTRDGYAIKHALEKGYQVAIITGGNSNGVVLRLQGLGIKHIYKGIHNKKEAYKDFLEKTGLKSSEILYMGDDIPDIPVMRLVALAACPKDACPEVIAIANYISPFVGGEGCVRDVIEKVLKLKGHWFQNESIN